MTLHLLLAATTSTTSSSSKHSSGSSYGFLIIILVLVAFYFLVLRPRSQRQRQARAQASTMDIGDQVMSVGGIKGVVVGMDDTDVRVEVAPGVVLNFIRKAVNPQPGASGPAGDDAAGVFDDDAEPTDFEHGGFEHEDFDDAGRAVEDSGRGTGEDETGTVTHDGPDDRPGTGTEGR